MTESTASTPEDLLASLRSLKRKLFSDDVTAEVARQGEKEQTAFVEQRMKLAETIVALETKQLQDIRQRLEEQGDEIAAGIDQLTRSLEEIEKAEQWARGLGQVLSSVAKIVPLGI